MLIAFLFYQHNAKAINNAEEFRYIKQNPAIEYILNNDFQFDSNYTPFAFAGVLDGRNHTIRVYTSLFTTLESCYIRNLTIISTVQTKLAESLVNAQFVLIRMQNLSFGSAKYVSFASSLIETTQYLFETSLNSTFTGCSIAAYNGSYAFDLITSSVNDMFYYTFVKLQAAFTTSSQVLSLDSCSVYYESLTNMTSFSLFAAESAKELGLVNTDIVLYVKHTVSSIYGLCKYVEGLNFFYSSMYLNISQVNEAHALCSEGISIFTWNASIFVNASGSSASAITGLSGKLIGYCFVSQTYIFFNLSVDSSAEQLTVAGFTKSIDANSFITRSVTVVSGKMQANKAIAFAGIAIDYLGKISDSQVVGSLVVNYTAGVGSTDYMVNASAIVLHAQSTIIDVYSNLNLSFVTAKQNQKRLLATGFMIVCSKCVVNNSAVFGSVMAQQNAAQIIISGLLWDTNDVCQFNSLQVYPVSLGVPEPNDKGEVIIVGLVYSIAHASITDVQVETVIHATRNFAMIACQLFKQFEAQSSLSLQFLSIRVSATDYQDISLGTSAYGSFTHLIIDCGIYNVNYNQPYCKTSAQMTNAAILDSLSDRWYISDKVNGGYPYCSNAFLRTDSKIIVPENSFINQSAYYFDNVSNMSFVYTDYDFCRGVCSGVGYSPCSFQCTPDVDNSWCVVYEQKDFLISQRCVESAVQKCAAGAQLCDRTAESKVTGCEKTCQVYHGYCRGAQPVCDMDYTGSSCAYFECFMQQNGCYGVGTCHPGEAASYCQCADHYYLYEDGKCANLHCPGLLHGICAENGAVCDANFTGSQCDKCALSGFVLKDGVCVKSNLWLIVGISVGALVLLAALVALAVVCVMKYYVKLIRRGEKYIKLGAETYRPKADKVEGEVNAYF